MDNFLSDSSISQHFANSDVVGLVFELVPTVDIRLFPDYVKGLHAWFLNQIQLIDPALSAYLHDGQSEKAFTLSRLQGPLEIRGRETCLKAQQSYFWYLSILSNRTMEGVMQWLSQPPQSLSLVHRLLVIKSIELFLPPLTYQNLWQGPINQQLELSFLSPTSFRRKDNHFPLPVPNNIFHSYLRRWNDFSGRVIEPEDFLNWIDECVRIDRHWLESLKVSGIKGGNFTGFVGAITLSLTPKGLKHRLYRQVWSALGRFAPYCGTGHKTTFGLGQTRLGWSLPETERSLFIVEDPKEETLDHRIEILRDMLLKQQKRPDNERAFKICHTKATILARREWGESLQAIASDLGIPYETARTYSKRAKKEILEA